MQFKAEWCNLAFTFECGQVFNAVKEGDWWYCLVGNQAFKMRQKGHSIEFEGKPESFIKRYLGLDVDLQAVMGGMCWDEPLRMAVNRFAGLRIVRQDPWDCLVSFICATNKNIPGITSMLQNLSRLGEQVKFNGKTFYALPTAKKVAESTVPQLLECGLGYRTNRLLDTARTVLGGFNLERLRFVPYEEAKQELCTLPGVGPKVADCVLLFSLDKTEAFPIDVWMKKIILSHYTKQFPNQFLRQISTERSLAPREYDVISKFARGHFGRYAGYAQEYLYHYERQNRSHITGRYMSHS
jgi:N-glycosylase/DNA lyase